MDKNKQNEDGCSAEPHCKYIQRNNSGMTAKWQRINVISRIAISAAELNLTNPTQIWPKIEIKGLPNPIQPNFET